MQKLTFTDRFYCIIRTAHFAGVATVYTQVYKCTRSKSVSHLDHTFSLSRANQVAQESGHLTDTPLSRKDYRQSQTEYQRNTDKTLSQIKHHRHNNHKQKITPLS